MAVFKEEIIALEELERKQEQIWGDSCDCGIYADPKIKNQMRNILKTLLNKAKKQDLLV